MTFEVVYDSIKRLTVMFESVVSITEIGNISFTDEGMLISTMDTSHVSFIRLWLDKEDFSKYNIENGEKVIGVSFKDIAKILKSLSTQNSSVTFRHTEALDTMLEIEVNDGFKHKFTSFNLTFKVI